MNCRKSAASQIKEDASLLVEKIRQYSRDQKEEWQQVPLLALQADGRDGYSDNRSRAYRTGYWALDASSQNGYYRVYVDLADGELVDAYHASRSFDVCGADVPKDSSSRPARDPEVLRLATSLEELDARALVSELKKEAGKPHSRYASRTEEEVKKWREEIKQENRLEKFYTRRK